MEIIKRNNLRRKAPALLTVESGQVFYVETQLGCNVYDIRSSTSNDG
jgi:hypothetical protein